MKKSFKQKFIDPKNKTVSVVIGILVIIPLIMFVIAVSWVVWISYQ